MSDLDNFISKRDGGTLSDEQKWGFGPEDYRLAETVSMSPGFHNRWRYDHAQSTWFEWTGVRWKQDRVRKINLALAEEANALLDKARAPEEHKAFNRLLNISTQERVLSALASMSGYSTSGDDWDSEPNLLGCENGVLDLTTGQLHTSPQPGITVTRSTGHDYTPFVPAEGQLIVEEIAKVAPKFGKFIMEVTSQDVEQAHFLLTWFGAGIFGIQPEQRFLLMVGTGRNGKGALKHAVMKALGEYAAQPDANMYSRTKHGPDSSSGARADLMALKGKRVCFFSEPHSGQFNEEMLKAHTGGDVISARTLYSSRVVEWLPTHTVNFLVNDVPAIEDIGPSMASRVMVADFRERYEGNDQNPRLYEELEAEAPVILGVLAYYARLWWTDYRNGLTLMIPPRVEAASRDFLNQHNPIADFIDTHLARERGSTVGSRRMYGEYISWHARSGRQDEPISETKFGALMPKSGFAKQRTREGIVYTGVRLLNAMELAESETE